MLTCIQKCIITTFLYLLSFFHQDYIRQTWALCVLIVACVGVVASLYITVYVALRVCDGTLNGPQVTFDFLNDNSINNDIKYLIIVIIIVP